MTPFMAMIAAVWTVLGGILITHYLRKADNQNPWVSTAMFVVCGPFAWIMLAVAAVYKTAEKNGPVAYRRVCPYGGPEKGRGRERKWGEHTNGR